jgi:cytochrome c6
MKKLKYLVITFLIILNPFFISKSYAINLEIGKNLFNSNCIACHSKGTNLIIPEKNLQKSILEANGMYSKDAIIYQVINGKNGMPAFGGRLQELEIEEIANYVLFASSKNFEFD